MTGKQKLLIVCPECLWDGKITICKSWKTLYNHAENHAPRWRHEQWNELWDGLFFFFNRVKNPRIESYSKTKNLKGLLLALRDCCDNITELDYIATVYGAYMKELMPEYVESSEKIEAQYPKKEDK